MEVRVVGVEGWRGLPADGDDGTGHGVGDGEAVQLRGHRGGILMSGPVPLRREGERPTYAGSRYRKGKKSQCRKLGESKRKTPVSDGSKHAV